MKRLSTILLLIGMICCVVTTGCSKSPQEKRATYLKSAQEYVDQKKFPEASIQYRNALKIAPDDADTLVKLGENELRQYRIREAFRAFAKASQADPKSMKALSNLTALFLLGKDYEQALTYADKMLKLNPKDIQARDYQAQALFLTGKKQEALKVVEDTLKEGALSETVLINAAKIYQGMNRGPDGVRLLENGLKTYPASTKLRFALSEIALVQKDPEAARTWAEDAYRVSKGELASGLRLAQLYVINHQDESLAKLLSELKQRYPQDPSPYMFEAQLALSKSDLNTALAKAKEAHAISDTNDTRYLLAEILFKRGEMDGAKELLEKNIISDPKTIASRLLLGRIAVMEKDHAKALEVMNPLIKQYPGNPEIALIIARAYLLKGDIDRARVAIDAALKVNQANAALHAVKADIDFRKGAFKDALQEADMVLAKVPAAPDMLYVGVISALRLGQVDKAALYLGNLKKHNPEAWPTTFAEVLYYGSRGDKNNAYQAADKGLSRWPEKPEALALYAKTAPAVIGLPAAINKIAPLCATAKTGHCRVVLAGLLEKSGKNAEALASIKQAIGMEPKRNEYYHYLAAFYTRHHMVKEALKEYEDILNKNPKDLGAASMLAMLHQNAGNIDDAVKSYNYILERDPSNALASNNMAWIIAEQGNKSELDRALQLAQKAKEKFPEDPRIADTLGYVYLKKGLNGNAQSQFALSLEQLPDDPTINFHMAQALAGQNQVKEALEFVNKALRSRADFKDRAEAQRLQATLSTKPQ